MCFVLSNHGFTKITCAACASCFFKCFQEEIQWQKATLFPSAVPMIDWRVRVQFLTWISAAKGGEDSVQGADSCNSVVHHVCHSHETFHSSLSISLATIQTNIQKRGSNHHFQDHQYHHTYLLSWSSPSSLPSQTTYNKIIMQIPLAKKIFQSNNRQTSHDYICTTFQIITIMTIMSANSWSL